LVSCRPRGPLVEVALGDAALDVEMGKQAIDAAWQPPVGLAGEQHQTGDEHRSDDECVEALPRHGDKAGICGLESRNDAQ